MSPAKLRKPALSAVRTAKLCLPDQDLIAVVDGVIFELVPVPDSGSYRAVTPTNTSASFNPSRSPQEELETSNETTPRQKPTRMRVKRRTDSESTTLGCSRSSAEETTGRASFESAGSYATPPSSFEGSERVSEDIGALSETCESKASQWASTRPPTPVIMRKPQPRSTPSPALSESSSASHSQAPSRCNRAPSISAWRPRTAPSSASLHPTVAFMLQLKPPVEGTLAIRRVDKAKEDREMRAEKGARVAKWAETQ